MSRLVLLDGNAILHRAYHALPPMTNDQGEPTNAVYGFVAMLLRVIEDLKPTHLAVAFDRPKPTFRKQLFKEYQAQRPEMDDALVSQVQKVHKVIKAMRIPIYEKDGYEADDVLGTIVKQACQDTKILRYKDTKNKQKENSPSPDISVSEYRNIQVVIVTGDRDLLQLVNERVKLYMPVKGLSNSKIFGKKEAEERMGVRPEQIPDYKALAGDPSDNYPGVAGIGPKTAIALLNKFNSVENLYKHIEKVTNPGVREKLISDKEKALLSYKLATVVVDVPLKFQISPTQLHDLLTREVIDVFGSLGFKTLLRRLSEMSKKTLESKNPNIDSKKQMELF